MSEKLFVFQTDQNGKVTNVMEVLKPGEYVDKTVYLDVIKQDDIEISFTITPLAQGANKPDTQLYLRLGEEGPEGVQDIGITPGHNQPRPKPGP